MFVFDLNMPSVINVLLHSHAGETLKIHVTMFILLSHF